MKEQGCFFTDEQRLTEDSQATLKEPDLYEFEVTNGEGGPLQGKLNDLTVDLNAGESAGVQGMLPGASEDGSYVYLVATGVLSEAGNEVHEKAVSGADNLYVLHDTRGGWTSPTFIARLSGDDADDWNGNVETGNLAYLTSRVSPNGRYLAFMSDRELTGYDNHDANSGEPDEEVFLYHAPENLATEPGSLVCASCDPSGARPVGVYNQAAGSGGSGAFGRLLFDEGKYLWEDRWLAGDIPGWTPTGKIAAFYQSRYLSDSGRLFFNSSDALVPQDVDGTEDVYEYEPTGVGSCARASSVIVGGCVGLVSSGRSTEESAFLDASESGGDVFFLTAAKLASQDYDTSMDVYDAHECTAQVPCVSSPAAPSQCTTADACRAASSSQPPIFGAPSSATFSGAGNPAPALAVAKAKVKAKPLTRAQKLAKALRGCRTKSKSKARGACEKQARKSTGRKPEERATTGGRGDDRFQEDRRRACTCPVLYALYARCCGYRSGFFVAVGVRLGLRGGRRVADDYCVVVASGSQCRADEPASWR